MNIRSVQGVCGPIRPVLVDAYALSEQRCGMSLKVMLCITSAVSAGFCDLCLPLLPCGPQAASSGWPVHPRIATSASGRCTSVNSHPMLLPVRSSLPQLPCPPLQGHSQSQSSWDPEGQMPALTSSSLAHIHWLKPPSTSLCSTFAQPSMIAAYTRGYGVNAISSRACILNTENTQRHMHSSRKHAYKSGT